MGRSGGMRREGSSSIEPTVGAAGEARDEGDRRLGVVAAIAFGLVVLVYAALKTYGFVVGRSDENIYFYMAQRGVFGGLWPYKDYFFAHPPLHLAFAVAALELGRLFHGTAAMLDPLAWEDGGAALEAVKAIGLVSGALGGVFIFRAARRAAGPIEGLIAGTLFLISPDLLHSYFTGVAEALMFAALGLERVVAGRERQAGLAFAAGCLVAMYVAPAGLAIWLVLRVVSPERARRLAVWTAVPLVLVHAACLVAFHGAYWSSVFAFHVHKPKNAGIMGHELLLLLRKSSALVLAIPAALVALGPRAELASRERLRAEPRRQLVAYGLASLVATLLFVGATRASFHYYFVMLMLGLAPLAGVAYAELLRRAVGVLGAVRARQAVGASLLSLALVLVWPVAGRALERLPAARRTQIPDISVGKAVVRHWQDSPALGPLNGVVQTLLWRDVEVFGQTYPIWTRYLWDATRRFTMAERFARYARSLPPDATIFGEPTIVTAVALMSGHRVSLDEADTNFMRFASGTTGGERFVALLRAAPPALVVFTAGEYTIMDPALKAWMERDYEASLANDEQDLVYMVMRPNPPPSR